jgi:prefoldin subunit 5
MTDQHAEIKRAIEDIRKRTKELKPSIAGKKNELRNLTVRFVYRSS